MGALGWGLGAVGAAAVAAMGAAAAVSSRQGERPRGPWAPPIDGYAVPRDWGWADVPEHERPVGWDRPQRS